MKWRGTPSKIIWKIEEDLCPIPLFQNFLEEENLEAHLRLEYDYRRWLPWWPLSKQHSQLSTAIRNDGKMLYCILILLDRQKDAQALLNMEPAVNDRTLFMLNHTGQRTFCSRDKLKRIIQFNGAVAEEVYRVQWYFPPTLYTETDEIQKFDLQHFKMPLNQIAKYIGSGAFGSVFGTEMRKEYLRHRKDTDSVSNTSRRCCSRTSA